MSDLKPCPFCGSNSAVFVREDKPFPYRVQCLNDDCACRTDNYKTYRFAIEAWNKRINEIPTINPQPQWIPTAKEHPPKHKNIWITDVCGDIDVVYRGNGSLWLSNDDNGYVKDEIIAWMPANVPLPYKKEGEEE